MPTQMLSSRPRPPRRPGRSDRSLGITGVALLLGSAMLAPAFASGPAAPPAAATPAPVPEIAVTRYTLDNGLTVLLSEDHRLPVVATEVRYRVGSGHEAKGRSGFAHLFEHLMFQGSQHYDNEYFKPFEPIGGNVNGTTNVDRTNFYEQVPSNALELSLWMQAERMRFLLPAMTQAKLDNQRDVVKNERRQRYENTPYGEVWRLVSENLYPVGHPYQHTTIGSHEDLTAASMDDVKAFFEQYYSPSNAILTLVGDFDPAVVRPKIEQYFGGAPKGARVPAPQPAAPKLDRAIHIVEKDQVNLARIHLAWHTPAVFADGDAALDVWASVLTDGKSSRLYQPLVYEQKVAKDVAAMQVSNHLTSVFMVQATVAPGRTVEELSTALLAALRASLEQPPTDDELARTLSGWRKSFYGRVEGVLSRAQLLSGYEHFVGRPDFLRADLERYTALTSGAVHSAARRWLPAAEPTQFLRVDIVPETPAAAAVPPPPPAKAPGPKPGKKPGKAARSGAEKGQP
jgi:zinc protease